MSKPTTTLEQLQIESKSRAMTHALLTHLAFMKLVNEALYPKTETSN